MKEETQTCSNSTKSVLSFCSRLYEDGNPRYHILICRLSTIDKSQLVTGAILDQMNTMPPSCTACLAVATLSSITAVIQDPTGHISLVLKTSTTHVKKTTSLLSSLLTLGIEALVSGSVHANIVSNTNFEGFERATPSEIRFSTSSALLKVRRTSRQPTRHILKASSVTNGLSNAGECGSLCGESSSSASSRSLSFIVQQTVQL